MWGLVCAWDSQELHHSVCLSFCVAGKFLGGEGKSHCPPFETVTLNLPEVTSTTVHNFSLPSVTERPAFSAVCHDSAQVAH